MCDSETEKMTNEKFLAYQMDSIAQMLFRNSKKHDELCDSIELLTKFIFHDKDVLKLEHPYSQIQDRVLNSRLNITKEDLFESQDSENVHDDENKETEDTVSMVFGRGDRVPVTHNTAESTINYLRGEFLRLRWKSYSNGIEGRTDAQLNIVRPIITGLLEAIQCQAQELKRLKEKNT